MKAEITFERVLSISDNGVKSDHANITYHGGIAVSGSVLSKTTVEILLGDIYKGLSAYEIAVRNGFEGTEEEWLSSLEYKPTVLSEQEYDALENKDDNTLYFITED